MPTKRFLIHYPDGTREQVPTAEKEQLLLAGELRMIDANRFEFIGKRKTMIFHDFRDLAAFAATLKVTPEQLRRFLAGQFVWEIEVALTGKKRLRELLQTPEAMALGLDTPSGPCCKFNPDYAMQESQRRASYAEVHTAGSRKAGFEAAA